jgi:hypothetical protein
LGEILVNWDKSSFWTTKLLLENILPITYPPFGQQPPIGSIGNPTGGPSQLGFMQPTGTKIFSGASFPGMASTPSNLPQPSGVGGIQVPIGQPFHTYTPSNHATGTQMDMDHPIKFTIPVELKFL